VAAEEKTKTVKKGAARKASPVRIESP